MKILFLVPDGVGIKNYLYSPLLSKLSQKGAEVALLHNLTPSAVHQVEKLHGIPLRSFPMHPYREKPHIKFLRESIAYARLLHNTRITGNETIMDNWKPPRAGAKKWFYKGVEQYGKYLSRDYKRIIKAEQKLSDWQFRENNPYLKLMDEYRPDIVVNLHQRAPASVLPVVAARRKGIKTTGAIYSWDNLPKARLTVRTDEYFVWSAHMKDEMKMYYPEINPESVHITGSPQFEFYYNPNLLWPKEKLYERYNIPINRKIVLYSGSDTRTSPFDGEYVLEFVRQLQKLPLPERPVVLLRPVPAEDGSRHRKALEQFPSDIILAPAIWERTGHWSTSIPLPEDLELMHNLVHYTETVINIGSTMALDYANKDKPAVYIKFNIKNDPSWDVFRIHNEPHYITMKGLDPVFWWKKKDEISDIITRIMQGEKKPDALEWLHRVNNYPKDASERIARYLTEKVN